LQKKKKKIEMESQSNEISNSNFQFAGSRKDTSSYEEINFEEIDEDLAAFQEDEMVQQALHRGVDLKKYGMELEKELKHVNKYSQFVSS
jgi:3-keto-L-gulonate-6-phosphate decarboxylase